MGRSDTHNGKKMGEKPTVKTLDFSAGDAAIPFTALAAHAFRRAAKDGLNRYVIPTTLPGISHPLRPVMDTITDYLSARGISSPEVPSG